MLRETYDIDDSSAMVMVWYIRSKVNIKLELIWNPGECNAGTSFKWFELMRLCCCGVSILLNHSRHNTDINDGNVRNITTSYNAEAVHTWTDFFWVHIPKIRKCHWMQYTVGHFTYFIKCREMNIGFYTWRIMPQNKLLIIGIFGRYFIIFRWYYQ